MKTLYIIQKRHPNSKKEWPHRNWHDNHGSRKDLSQSSAINEAKRLQSDSDRCEYRVIKRTEGTIFTANKEIAK